MTGQHRKSPGPKVAYTAALCLDYAVLCMSMVSPRTPHRTVLATNKYKEHLSWYETTPISHGYYCAHFNYMAWQKWMENYPNNHQLLKVMMIKLEKNIQENLEVEAG